MAIRNTTSSWPTGPTVTTPSSTESAAPWNESSPTARSFSPLTTHRPALVPPTRRLGRGIDADVPDGVPRARKKLLNL